MDGLADGGQRRCRPLLAGDLARTGEVPLGAGEGIAFTAEDDRPASRCPAHCTYAVVGQTPAARLWTLTAYDSDGRLMVNAAQRSGFHSREIVRRPDGSFVITVSPEVEPGNWLPVARVDAFPSRAPALRHAAHHRQPDRRSHHAGRSARTAADEAHDALHHRRPAARRHHPYRHRVHGALLRRPRRLGGDAPFGRDGQFHVLPVPEAGAEPLASLDPRMLQAVCRFSLGRGPVRIQASFADDFWSVAVFDRRGRNIYSLNDRSAERARLDLAILTPVQMAQLRQDPPASLETAIVQELPIDVGFVLLRAFVPDNSLMAERHRIAQGGHCAGEPCRLRTTCADGCRGRRRRWLAARGLVEERRLVRARS